MHHPDRLLREIGQQVHNSGLFGDLVLQVGTVDGDQAIEGVVSRFDQVDVVAVIHGFVEGPRDAVSEEQNARQSLFLWIGGEIFENSVVDINQGLYPR